LLSTFKSTISFSFQQNRKYVLPATYFHAGSFCKHRVFQTLKVHLNADKLILYAKKHNIIDLNLIYYILVRGSDDSIKINFMN